VRLYRLLEREMVDLHPMWNQADGLAEPVEEALARALGDPDVLVYVGELEGAALGFLLARSEPLLPQSRGAKVGAIRLVYVEPEGREVGLGEAMLEAVMDELRRRGHQRFDAHVLPGHRMAKNFFEAAGFAARSIVMHHNDGTGS
jgi:GNAT superfamily N-acetyltransferase